MLVWAVCPGSAAEAVWYSIWVLIQPAVPALCASNTAHFAAKSIL